MDLLIIEVCRDSATATRFRRKGNLLTFTAALTRPMENEASFQLLLQEHAAPLEGNTRVVLCLDPSSFYSRELEIPISDRKKLREILPLELKGETAVDSDELIFDTLSLKGAALLAIWTRRSDVAAMTKIMLDAGLEPQIVTSAPFQWQSLLPENAYGTVALSDGSALVVYHDREPFYFRSLGRDASTREIEKTLAALELGKGVTVRQLFLIGNAAALKDLPISTGGEELLSLSRLPVTAELAEAFGENSAVAVELASAWATARAAFSPGIVNFRYGDLAYTAGFERVRNKLRFTAALAALFVLLLFVETAVRYYLVNKDLDSINSSIRGMYKEIFPNRKKPVDEVAEIKSEIKRMGGGAATEDPLGTLKKLAALKGDGINGFFETEIEENQVRLKGEAVSFQAVNDFKARTGNMFTKGDVGEIKPRADGNVTFTFHGTLQEGSK